MRTTKCPECGQKLELLQDPNPGIAETCPVCTTSFYPITSREDAPERVKDRRQNKMEQVKNNAAAKLRDLADRYWLTGQLLAGAGLIGVVLIPILALTGFVWVIPALLTGSALSAGLGLMLVGQLIHIRANTVS